MRQYLQFVSQEFLEKRGATAVPKLPNISNNADVHDPAARRAWRWLTFAMPGDLLLAGLAINNSGPVRVNTLSPGVEIILREGGYAETHLHLGAALDFPTVWASAVNVVGRAAPGTPSFSPNSFKSPGADFSEGILLSHWLVRCAIVRYLLASYLQGPGVATTLSEYFTAVGETLEKRFFTATHRKAIRTAIRDLYAGGLNTGHEPITRNEVTSFASLQNAYNAISQVSNIDLPTRLDQVQRLDPLSSFFTPHAHSGPSVQLQFLWSGIEYMENSPQDVLFAQLFWQVERVRGIVYRHCIQRPLTPGLMNFIRYYERKSPITGALDRIELESSGRLGGMGHGLGHSKFVQALHPIRTSSQEFSLHGCSSTRHCSASVRTGRRATVKATKDASKRILGKTANGELYFIYLKCEANQATTDCRVRLTLETTLILSRNRIDLGTAGMSLLWDCAELRGQLLELFVEIRRC